MIPDDGNTAADQLSIVRHQTCVSCRTVYLIQSALETAPYTLYTPITVDGCELRADNPELFPVPYG
jgi:hypothetical protein